MGETLDGFRIVVILQQGIRITGISWMKKYFARNEKELVREIDFQSSCLTSESIRFFSKMSTTRMAALLEIISINIIDIFRKIPYDYT
jgi:hypothetical protein